MNLYILIDKDYLMGTETKQRKTRTNMKTFRVVCIEKNKAMQDADAKFKGLGHVNSIDGSDIESKVQFNRDVWRICVIAEVK